MDTQKHEGSRGVPAFCQVLVGRLLGGDLHMCVRGDRKLCNITGRKSQLVTLGSSGGMGAGQAIHLHRQLPR